MLFFIKRMHITRDTVSIKRKLSCSFLLKECMFYILLLFLSFYRFFQIENFVCLDSRESFFFFIKPRKLDTLNKCYCTIVRLNIKYIAIYSFSCTHTYTHTYTTFNFIHATKLINSIHNIV